MPLPLLAWEGTVEHWRQLHAVILTETALREFRPMLGMLASLRIKAGAPFDPEARMRHILEGTAHIALAELRTVFYASRDPARIAWEIACGNGSRYSTSTRGLETSAFRDISMSKPATGMLSAATAFRRRSADGKCAGSVYWLGFRDETGTFLDGGKCYRLTVPALVPGDLFCP